MKNFKKSLVLGSVVLGLSGCSSSYQGALGNVKNGLGMEQKTVKNENLEIPELLGLSDIRTVGLEWKVQSMVDVEGYRVYRANYKDQKPKFKLDNQINDRYVKHYVDSGLEPSTIYLYGMSTIKGGQESLMSTPLKMKTKATPEPTPYIIAYSDMPASIKVAWTPSPDYRVNAYLLERYDVDSKRWEKVKLLKNRLTPEYIDDGLKNGTEYRYRLRSVIDNRNIVGRPTKVVSAKTKSLPPVVEGIKTQKAPQRVHLSWKSSYIEDFDHYNIYRILDWQYVRGVVLYKEKVGSTKETSFMDDLPGRHGEGYWYFITTVDIDGLESPLQKKPVYGKTLERPESPKVEKASYENGNLSIVLSNDSDRIKYHKVYKRTNKKFFIFDTKVESFKGRGYEDVDLNKEYDYEYFFTNVDKEGIESERSEGFKFDPKNPSL